MNNLQNVTTRNIRPKTIKLIGQLLRPWINEGIVSVHEEREIISNLKHISEKGNLLPVIIPKLIDQKEAGEMLGIGLSNFKKLEREGSFSFKRRMVGSAVRYRNTDIVKYIMSEDEINIKM